MARGSSKMVLFGLFLGGTAYAQPVTPRITVTTTPPGAKVYVDSKDKGIACQSGPSCKPRLAKGTHRLILELDGYKPLEETINVSGPQTLAFTLQPAPARVDIKTLATNQAAQGGEIFIDGTLSGSVPTTIEVPAGKHMIEIRRPGFQTYTEAIEVKGGESRPLFVALTAEKQGAPTAGALVITSELPGSEVIVDEQPRGPAPVLVENLAAGDHVVELRPKDRNYQPWRRNVRVVPGQQSAAYATFTANPPPPPAPLPPPPPPGTPVFPVAFVPRSTGNSYVVTTAVGQSCTTPCTLPLPPGDIPVSVSGPGSNVFHESVQIPTVPSQVTVQHFTTGRLVGGIVVAVLGLPLIAVGTIYLANPLSLPREVLPETRDQANAIGGALLGAGGALTLAGIITAAFTKTNRAEVRALSPFSPRMAARPRLLGAGIAPTSDRSGAVAGLAFSY